MLARSIHAFGAGLSLSWEWLVEVLRDWGFGVTCFGEGSKKPILKADLETSLLIYTFWLQSGDQNFIEFDF